MWSSFLNNLLYVYLWSISYCIMIMCINTRQVPYIWEYHHIANTRYVRYSIVSYKGKLHYHYLCILIYNYHLLMRWISTFINPKIVILTDLNIIKKIHVSFIVNYFSCECHCHLGNDIINETTPQVILTAQGQFHYLSTWHIISFKIMTTQVSIYTCLAL